MKIQVKKINPEAILPKFSQAGDVAADLYAAKDIILKPDEIISCPTGVAMKIPKGYSGLIWDKSGPSHKFGLKTLGGVIDNNYTGEILVGLINLGKEKFEIKKDQKIAQMLFQKIETPDFEEVEDLPNTNRGERGFGSTGIF